MDIKSIILSPIITEQSTKNTAYGKFAFKVAKNADKKMIKKAIEGAFKVNVTKVATSIVKGKTIRTGARRTEVAKAPFKKAIVALKKGQTISLFDVGGQK